MTLTLTDILLLNSADEFLLNMWQKGGYWKLLERKEFFTGISPPIATG
jgi:hypothetical protein